HDPRHVRAVGHDPVQDRIQSPHPPVLTFDLAEFHGAYCVLRTTYCVLRNTSLQRNTLHNKVRCAGRIAYCVLRKIRRLYSPCHLVTLSPCHLVTLSPCHLVSPSPPHYPLPTTATIMSP